jgi:hypothetical protein
MFLILASRVPRGADKETGSELSFKGRAFVHMSPVKGWLRSFNDGQTVSYEILNDNRFGKTSADPTARATVPHRDCRSRN